MDIFKRQPVDDPRPTINTPAHASIFTRHNSHFKKHLRQFNTMSGTPPRTARSEKDLEDAKRPVAPAKLGVTSLYRDKKTGFEYNQLQYGVPLKHRKDAEETILVTVRVVLTKNTTEVQTDQELEDAPLEILQDECGVKLESDKPIAVYLVGGPGSDNPPTSNPEITEYYLKKGFQVLFMDYRGTGSSNLQRADHLNLAAFKDGKAQAYKPDATPSLLNMSPAKQAEMLTWYRQDNIVRDLEAVRKSLLLTSRIKAANKWTLIGQSYGGWVSYTYLSFYPEALHMVLVTGGIPPVGQSADTVYMNTYATVIKACDAFYDKYDYHEESVRRILEFIYDHGKDAGGNRIPMKMPGGGILTPERFLCVGRTLGTTDGDGKVDKALNMCIADIDAKKHEFDVKTLIAIESWLRFEERPLYAILQEPIYTEHPLPASNWSAKRIGDGRGEYWWLEPNAFQRVFSPRDEADKKYGEKHFVDKRIYMSAEHVYPFHYDQFHALQPLKEAAKLLAKKDDWLPLFDLRQLSNNEVPISSLSYDKDMFIDWKLSQDTVLKMGRKNIHVDNDPELMHTAVKDKWEIVLPRLWNHLREAAQGILGRKLREDELESASSVIDALEKAKK